MSLLTSRGGWAAAVVYLFSSPVHAIQCNTGFQPHGDVCVSQRISDFIACVEASGGNRKQLYSQIASSINNGGGGKVSATASGLVVSGEGAVEIDKSAEQRLSNTLSSTYFDRAMENCREALKDVTPSATPPIDPPRQAPPVPPTVIYKVCSGEYESACPAHDVYLYCYSDVVNWAKGKCGSYGVTRYNTYGGNKCGYGMDLVTCVDPK